MEEPRAGPRGGGDGRTRSVHIRRAEALPPARWRDRSGGVEDRVATERGALETRRVEHVAAPELGASVTQPSRARRVADERSHRPAVRGEPFDDVRADEPGRAGDERTGH